MVLIIHMSQCFKLVGTINSHHPLLLRVDLGSLVLLLAGCSSSQKDFRTARVLSCTFLIVFSNEVSSDTECG